MEESKRTEDRRCADFCPWCEYSMYIGRLVVSQSTSRYTTLLSPALFFTNCNRGISFIKRFCRTVPYKWSHPPQDRGRCHDPPMVGVGGATTSMRTIVVVLHRGIDPPRPAAALSSTHSPNQSQHYRHRRHPEAYWILPRQQQQQQQQRPRETMGRPYPLSSHPIHRR